MSDATETQMDTGDETWYCPHCGWSIEEPDAHPATTLFCPIVRAFYTVNDDGTWEDTKATKALRERADRAVATVQKNYAPDGVIGKRLIEQYAKGDY